MQAKTDTDCAIVMCSLIKGMNRLLSLSSTYVRRIVMCAFDVRLKLWRAKLFSTRGVALEFMTLAIQYCICT